MSIAGAMGSPTRLRRVPPLRATSTLITTVALAVVVLGMLAGCSNSILGNAAAAGYETLTEAPAATPTTTH